MQFTKIFRAGLAALTAMVFLAGAAKSQELVKNGGFTLNSFGVTQFNLGNANFNAGVASCTAFGTAEEIDLVYNADFGPVPPVGKIKIGLHSQVLGPYDAFSTTLNSGVSAGQQVQLQFDFVCMNLTDMEVGISNNPSAFGTQCYNAVGTLGWVHHNVTVTAPVSGQYLTFRPAPSILGGYGFIAKVSLRAQAPRVTSLTAMPREIRTGQRSELTLTLDRAAGVGGLTCSISLSARALGAPSTVTVPAGARSVKFLVFGQNFGTVDRRVDITARSGASSATTSVIVHP